MIPSRTRPADRSISRLSYEDIWRNDYPNLTIEDRLKLAQAILADLDDLGVDILTNEVDDPIYVYRCTRHCHFNLKEAK